MTGDAENNALTHKYAPDEVYAAITAKLDRFVAEDAAR